MLERREVLKLALAGLATGAAVQTAHTEQPASLGFALGDPQPFQPGMMADKARALAKQPFTAPPTDVPGPLRNLSYDQYVAIRNRPGTAIWANEMVGFALEPLHRGFLFTMPVEINLVTQGEARRLLYSSNLYDFGKISVPPDMGDIGFSGFRIVVPHDKGGFSEIAAFQGASFFRAVAPGQNPGTMARALSIKTADPRGEEFPMIRAFWIERPTSGCQYASRPCSDRLGKRRRRLPFHPTSGRRLDHRYGMHVVRPHRRRQSGSRYHERDCPVRPARPSPPRRHTADHRRHRRDANGDRQE